MEIGEANIDDARLAEVTEAIRQAPPVAFDLARQVRVCGRYQLKSERRVRPVGGCARVSQPSRAKTPALFAPSR
jgi:hypothetical protein